jgi:hypothetical protein
MREPSLAVPAGFRAVRCGGAGHPDVVDDDIVLHLAKVKEHAGY